LLGKVFLSKDCTASFETSEIMCLMTITSHMTVIYISIVRN
jgi:hypothetical protein